MKTKIFIVLSFLFITLSCSKKDSTPAGSGGGGGGTTLDCSSVAKSFSANVQATFQSSCSIVSCHASGSTNGPGALTTYTQIFNARTSIRASVAAGTMPKSGTITTAQKNSILCWIDSGAPNN